MSDLENPTVPVPDAVPAPDAVPEPIPEPTPASARGRRGLALRVAAAVVAAALAGVGIGVGIIKVTYDDAPQAAAAAAPQGVAAAPAQPHPYGAQANGTHFGSLLDLLLPVPAGYKLGPDDGAAGNDAELTPDQVAAALDDSVKDLPKTERDKAKGVLQGMKVKGEGVRTFRSSTGDMALYLRLSQFNQKSVEAESAFEGALGSETGLFRLGPEVPGHPEAHCFLPPAEPGDPIDELDCTAAVGDLLVELHVAGVAPLPKAEAVSVFRQQLDRLALPGATV